MATFHVVIHHGCVPVPELETGGVAYVGLRWTVWEQRPIEALIASLAIQLNAPKGVYFRLALTTGEIPRRDYDCLLSRHGGILPGALLLLMVCAPNCSCKKPKNNLLSPFFKYEPPPPEIPEPPPVAPRPPPPPTLLPPPPPPAAPIFAVPPAAMYYFVPQSAAVMPNHATVINPAAPQAASGGFAAIEVPGGDSDDDTEEMGTEIEIKPGASKSPQRKRRKLEEKITGIKTGAAATSQPPKEPETVQEIPESESPELGPLDKTGNNEVETGETEPAKVAKKKGGKRKKPLKGAAKLNRIKKLARLEEEERMREKLESGTICGASVGDPGQATTESDDAPPRSPATENSDGTPNFQPEPQNPPSPLRVTRVAKVGKATIYYCKHEINFDECVVCGGAKGCEHGNLPRKCKICHPPKPGRVEPTCAHDVLWSLCEICNVNCPHGEKRPDCSTCILQKNCRHGIRRGVCAACKNAERCPHRRFRRECKECNPGEFCEHGKVMLRCKVCGYGPTCEHGKQTYRCKICSGCEHGKVKVRCGQCQGKIQKPPKTTAKEQCEHGRVKERCKICGAGGPVYCMHHLLRGFCAECGGWELCPHSKRKSQCRECNVCPHGKSKIRCKPCGGSGICKHGKIKAGCRECGGYVFCPHDKRKDDCLQCSKYVCVHGKIKRYCRDCGGARICKHGRDKYHCRLCKEEREAGGGVSTSD